jgi:D-glycero-alpha-D-manno-heptose-7-phosphate kinase
LSPRVRDALERRCLIIYTGQSRISGDTIEGVLGAYRAREPRVVGALQRMKELAESMTDALRREDVDELGALVGEQWQHQRSLHPAIPTERIDAIIATAARTGAIGSKALGASGGGCVLVISAEGREAELREVLAPLGQLLPFAIDLTGAARCR